MADVILEFFAAVNRRDLDAIEACYHSDYESVQPCFPTRRFEGPGGVRRIYEQLYPRVPGVRYEIKRTSFTDHGNGRVTGFVETHMTDDRCQTNVKGVFIMEVDDGKIRHGSLYMTPVSLNGGNIDAYVEGLAANSSGGRETEREN